MPAPAYPLPPSLPPLHLYRHLLREASYLPPAFRATIDSTIRTRFHKSRQDGMHTKSRLAKAVSTLRTLRAANSGAKNAMQSLIMKGFGRTGSRRRQLVAHLVKPQGPSDTQALETLMEDQAGKKEMQAQSVPPGASNARLARKPKNDFFEKWDRPKLLKILESQRRHQKVTKGTTSWPVMAVRTTDPDQFVPKTNIWGRPPAECLVRAKRAHWWRRSADKIMPPLGKGEWDLLQRLSRGVQAEGEWAVPRRRHHASSEVPSSAESVQAWKWQSYATTPVARIEKPRTMPQRRRTGQCDTGPYGGHERSQHVSNRWFRRAYNRTWQLTPTLEQDPNTLQYSLCWGTTTCNLPAATTVQQGVFESVDRRGNKLRKEPNV
ncbi:uncharacterized protein MAM_03064 [Metarhizium album ARSEF 1941]|uniref:LYR motif-containing protein Cup1-like N-terminal domain-containing protein n=1 Tax=Metarhizium album (strain ARSEF 1941) TaxID=1081103 RepID=A0A0B2WTG4_METAS|nr:uncharacterized protein MAM_03064 [Metarhizium album ARSEF 1941]KHN99366.1 hypothetical protein MAM_03064 [Metarhizium album ARSEF 1941]